MNKAETYCYVIREHLKNKKARVCLYYSNQHTDPQKRIEVKRTSSLQSDLLRLAKLTKEEIPGNKKIEIQQESETFKRGVTATTIEKYFLCFR